MDSPRSVAYDAFYRNLYKNHHYGNTMTKTLEDLDKIQKSDILDAYNNIINNSQKVMSVVGDFNNENILKTINDKFNYLKNQEVESKIEEVSLNEEKIIKIEKEDVAQAQIILGYLCESYQSQDYAPILVMNTLLGACGLSSRLFLELRG
ncbi:MAG: insulinase family protein [Candidatus Melainabacteria bacterium]|nr:MAG: insulinase family protein [Candidatus Melainabacteria bacterium]